MNWECTGRLLVLVPVDTNYSAATRDVWKLAQATKTQVQLIGLCRDTNQEPALRRGLFAMASLLEDGKIFADVRLNIGTNWVNILKTCYEPGDMIVCFSDQRTGFFHKPLSQVLESNFKATVFLLSQSTPPEHNPNILARVGAWLGFIGIITGFGVLQANIVRLPEGWLQNILLMLSIIPEFWLIGVWGGQFR